MNAAQHFDAVVVGSGFGGSVSAYRLAEAGLSVCVLERGKAYAPGDFPRSPYDLSRSFWDPSEGQYGIYNIWSFDGLGGLVSSGLGGGSLIYANVLLRKPEDTFVLEDGSPWPVTRAELEPHYAEVERMLGAQAYPFAQEPYSGTRKTRAMEAAAVGVGRRLGVPDTNWILPNLAVTFANPGEPPRLGVAIENAAPSAHAKPHPRLTCLLTGECNLGCNYGSKNTLDLNYLGRAKELGAELRTLADAKTIERLPDGGYRVGYVAYGDPPETARGQRREVTANVLVIAAGTFGSTFLLLRNRAALPRLSGELGTRFGGNGDLLTFLVKAREAGGGPRVLEASYGPVITSAIHVPFEPGSRRGHYVEDAGYPYLVSWLTQLTTLPWITRTLLRLRWRVLLRRLTGRGPDTDLGAEFAKLLGNVVLSSSSMPMLGMGRDVPDGRLFLDDEGRLTTDWRIDSSRAYFEELERTARAIAAELGGEFRDSRIRRLTRLVTVHPLGGCPMGRNEREGVVDTYGQAFNYPGLFVADGAVMPGAVGPNPSLTIAALADRFAERMVDAARA